MIELFYILQQIGEEKRITEFVNDNTKARSVFRAFVNNIENVKVFKSEEDMERLKVVLNSATISSDDEADGFFGLFGGDSEDSYKNPYVFNLRSNN